MPFLSLCRSWIARAALSGCLLVMFVPPAVAGRDIGILVSLEGKPWLVGAWGDNGKANADGVWQYLKTASLQVAKDGKVEPDAKDKSRAKLVGKIEVKIRYGGTATVKELNLVRDKRDPDRWLDRAGGRGCDVEGPEGAKEVVDTRRTRATPAGRVGAEQVAAPEATRLTALPAPRLPPREPAAELGRSGATLDVCTDCSQGATP